MANLDQLEIMFVQCPSMSEVRVAICIDRQWHIF